MADAKISALTGVSTPVAGTEVLPIVQSGSTKKVSVDNLTKGRTVNALSFDTDVAAAGVTLSGTTLAADGTDANIDINITPKGTGEVNITKVDIDGGAIDGTPIGANSASTGAFSTSVEVQTNSAGGGISTYYDKAAYANIFGKLRHYGDSGGLRLVNVNSSSDRSFDFYSGTTEAGATKKFGVDGSGNFAVSLGNIVIGTSGKGIDFSATAEGSGTSTSELLDDYEEGTWTPTINTGAGQSITYVGQYGSYCKIGRLVYVTATFSWSALTAGANTHATFGGLPFTTNTLGGTDVAYPFGFGNPYDSTYALTVSDITGTQATTSPSGSAVYILRGGQSGTSNIYVKSSELKTTGSVGLFISFVYQTTT
jgi:hypothetical protein